MVNCNNSNRKLSDTISDCIQIYPISAHLNCLTNSCNSPYMNIRGILCVLFIWVKRFVNSLTCIAGKAFYGGLRLHICLTGTVKTELKYNITYYTILDSVFLVTSLWHTLGSIFHDGLLFFTFHPGQSLFLFFLFVQQSIVESHPCKQNNTGDDEEDPAALVCVLVIMIDVFKLPCEENKKGIA